MLISRPQKYKKSSNKTTCKQSSIILRPVRVSRVVVARQQKTPLGRTLPFLAKWFPPLSRGWHCPQGVLPARRRARRHFSTSRRAFVARQQKTPLGRTLPPFPASRYAELVSGGHLPTIPGAHISAPAGPCILRQQNMERQVGRQG